ncbi:MAG: hypothetical protein Q8Q33_06310 [Chlamydiota bacterium]|nr:hypothetical protein [Chlamydiota bacterium]
MTPYIVAGVGLFQFVVVYIFEFLTGHPTIQQELIIDSLARMLTEENTPSSPISTYSIFLLMSIVSFITWLVDIFAGKWFAQIIKKYTKFEDKKFATKLYIKMIALGIPIIILFEISLFHRDQYNNDTSFNIIILGTFFMMTVLYTTLISSILGEVIKRMERWFSK